MFRRCIRSLRLPVGLLILTLLLASCTFEVQPIEEYTSADGSLSFEYPVAWEVLMEDPSDLSYMTVVGTRPDIHRYDVDAIPAGEAWVAIALMPTDLTGVGSEGQTLTAEDYRALLVPGSAGDPAGAGEIESVPLDSGKVAYSYSAPTDLYDMTVTMFEPADQMLATVVVAKAHADDDAALRSEISAILSSIRYRGDPSALSERIRETRAGNR